MFLIPEDVWEVRKTTKKGRGVFVTKDIEVGTIIGDYLGTVIHPKDEDEIDEEENFYLMYYHDTASVFPDLSKPGIYLLNHSCTPNAWMYTYRGHTLFFALRHIFPGEELTINYLLSPQDELCAPCTHMCSCEGVICHQTMHLSKKRYAFWSDFHNNEMSETKAERIRYGKQLPALAAYPKAPKDHPVYDLFGATKEKPAIMKDSKLPKLPAIRQEIKHSGRTLLYPKLNLHILGVSEGHIISKVA